MENREKYDVLIHECSIPLDGTLKIPGYKLKVFSKPTEEQGYLKRRYTPEKLFDMFGVPKVFVRGHVPNGFSRNSEISLIEDIEWVRYHHPEVYLIAFKSDMHRRKVENDVHVFLDRGRSLEKDLVREIIKGLDK